MPRSPKRPAPPIGSPLDRIHAARQELEEAALELKRFLDATRSVPAPSSPRLPGLELLALELPSLERALAALRNVIEQLAPQTKGRRVRALPIVAAGTREAVARASSVLDAVARATSMIQQVRASAAEPSLAAQVLAVLLEAPGRELDAAGVAERLGCTAAIARTTLHRLVQGGHAERTAPGRFRVKGS